MVSIVVLLAGLAIAASMIAGSIKLPPAARAGGIVAAIAVAVAGGFMSSVRFVGADQVGVVKKNALGPRLPAGQIIATDGEMGVQAQILPPGWHFGLWPVIFDVTNTSLVEIPQDQVGLVEARDGKPLDAGQLFAPEMDEAEFRRLVDNAALFLTEGGRKGPQTNVLKPGKYRLNPELFRVTIVDATDVPNASVAVLKANFGGTPTLERVVVEGDEPVLLARPGEKGVRADAFPPGKYPVNTSAYQVTQVSTRETILRFTSGNRAVGQRSAAIPGSEEREITVRTSDGFTFPVDVRIEYRIEPQNAPIVVAKLGSDGDPLLSKMNSTVRAIFRNNAENVKALDYVSQRSLQETQSLSALREEMTRVGVTVLAVRIGDVGDEETLGDLLNTQREREIAVQEQITLQEQQRAAEQRKQLTRTEQEAEEERRLATASYQVKIAGQDKERRIIEANAQAEAVRIEAQAQADAYRLISQQLGPTNAALIELLKIAGEGGVQITPRVMVTGSGGGNESGTTTALVGTLLDRMVREEAPREGAQGAQTEGGS
ncbi:MAG: SPFH domain-containing protein [Planctomycetota bacterium]